jgi:hypothetical protein
MSEHDQRPYGRYLDPNAVRPAGIYEAIPETEYETGIASSRRIKAEAIEAAAHTADRERRKALAEQHGQRFDDNTRR